MPPSLLLFFSFRFLRLWIAVLVIYPTNQAVIALTFSNYVLQPLFPTCFPPESGLRLLAGVCLCEWCFLCLCLHYGERNLLYISCCSPGVNVKEAETGGGLNLNLNLRSLSSGIGRRDQIFAPLHVRRGRNDEKRPAIKFARDSKILQTGFRQRDR